MFIVTITDADGMTYVEGFSEMKGARDFIPPAWAKLKTPTKRECVRWSRSLLPGVFAPSEIIDV